MSLEDGQKLYTLKHPLSYSVTGKGETRQAQFLELREPGMSHSRGYLKMKQMVTGLMMGSAQKMQEMGIERDSIVSGSEVKKLHDIDQDQYDEEADNMAEMLNYCFGMSTEIDLCHFVETFEKIACNSRQKSICAIDGEEPMASAIWEKLHPEDAAGAAIAWASFFTMPSDFQKPKESGSA
jgi:hypothetical protein